MDSEREESIRRRRLAAQIQRLAQLCIPIPDAANMPQSGTPSGCWPGRWDRSRSPLPLDPSRSLLPALVASAARESSSSACPALFAPHSPPTPAGEFVTNWAPPQAPNAYAHILSLCSQFLGAIAQAHAASSLRGAPGSQDHARADLRHLDITHNLVAHVLLVCLHHDEEHDTHFAARLRRDLADVHRAHAHSDQLEPTDLEDAATAAVSQSRHGEIPDTPLAEPVRPSTQHVLEETPARVTPTPLQTGVPLSRHALEDTPSPGEEAMPSAPCSPGSSTLACQEAEAMLDSPPRPASHARLYGPVPAEHATPRSRSPRRSPTLSPYAACRRAGMGTHRIAVYRAPGVTPPTSPSSSQGSR